MCEELHSVISISIGSNTNFQNYIDLKLYHTN